MLSLVLDFSGFFVEVFSLSPFPFGGIVNELLPGHLQAKIQWGIRSLGLAQM